MAQLLKGYSTTEPLEKQFEHIAFRVRSVVQGHYPGIVLCGAPGIGKTFTVRKILEEQGLKEGTQFIGLSISSDKKFHQFLSAYRHIPVSIIDDSEGFGRRREVLNAAKGAFGSDHKVYHDYLDDFPNPITDIQLRPIWCTNVDYTNLKTRRADLQVHWEALISRGIHPIYIDTSDQFDLFKYIVRIACLANEQPHTTGNMWGGKLRLKKETAEEVIRFFIDQRNYFKDLSPRTMAEIIKHYKATEHQDRNNRVPLLRGELNNSPRNPPIPAIPYPTIIGAGKWRDIPT